jgi:dihydropteroate synthase
MKHRRTYSISWDRFRLDLGARTCVMGILNVTPDSFSDGGRFFDIETAVIHGERLVSEGADILDIGGESTRPFSDDVSAEEEMRRVIPVIERLAPRIPIPISIDTNKASVAQQALESGAAIINDVSALRNDSRMPDVAAKYGVPVILMHMLDTPKTMQISPEYTDLIGQIRQFLVGAVEGAEKRGVSRSKLILDPGIGFGKTIAHNLVLLQRLSEFNDMDLPLLVGSSRKAFIRKILKDPETGELPPDHPKVMTGSQAAVCAAVFNGAHIVRVHDVAPTRATLEIVDAILNAE